MTFRGVLASLAAFAVLAAACGDDDTALTTPTTTTAAPATTSTSAPPPTTATTSTAAPSTTTTAATTTTTAAPTTTSTTTTAVPPFNGTVDPKQGTMSGSPDARLVDVRVGSHPGFTRVVWEMDGSLGTPMYQIGYSNPPFENIGGFTVPLVGATFIHVMFFPGMRYDITDPVDIIQTYLGPETIPVNAGSVTEVVFLEDFEANMEWIIGLTAQKPFHVFTLENPTRLVIDIGH